MKRREAKGPSSTDLLVCFPTRSHLTLMPKMICSPSGSSNTYNHRLSHHHRGKSTGGVSDGGLWSKKTQMESDLLSEPTSPKVTCAGQIKSRPKSGPCKNWQSVMEEIQSFHKHNNKKYTKKPSWCDTLGFKKESMQFLTCLRSFKFYLGCFGTFPNANVTSDEDDDDNDNEDDDEEVNHAKKLMVFEGYDHDKDFEEGSSKSSFSKWFMFLEENKDCGLLAKEKIGNHKDGEDDDGDDDDDDDDDTQSPCVPPQNALLSMRCRSTPTKILLEEKEEENGDDDVNDDDDGDGDDDDDDEHDDGKKREILMDLMEYEGDFYKLSCDIAKETWVVGGITKPCSRTQSSQRSSTECLQEVIKACLR